ncbi:MAG: hypothetical protein ACR2ID_11960 [Chthoniobacterales bacterium]
MFFRLLVFLLLVSVLDASGKVTRLAAEDRQKIEHPTTITMLRAMRDLPRSVINACATVSAERSFALADPGGRFQVTDALAPGDENLPRRRLIWAATIPGYYVVHYESGGIAHTYHLLVVAFDKSEKATRVIWAAAAVSLADYAEFLHALKAGKLDDTVDYHH